VRATPAHGAQINAVLALAHYLPTTRHVPDAKVLGAGDKTQIWICSSRAKFCLCFASVISLQFCFARTLSACSFVMELPGILEIRCISGSIFYISGTVKQNLKRNVTKIFCVKWTGNYNVKIRNEK
jgi:hypothetical protein